MVGFNSFGDYLLTLQLLNICVFVTAAIVSKRRGYLDPTSDDFPNKWVITFAVTWLFWLVLLVVHLVYMLIIREWFGAGIDVLLLIWVWWDFFGGSGKWKKWKKRAKERVAVIKGRLKVVPVAPVPA